MSAPPSYASDYSNKSVSLSGTELSRKAEIRTVPACGIRAVIRAPAGRGYRGTLNHRLFPQQYPILAALVSVKIINDLSFTRYPRPAGVHRRPGWAPTDGHFREMDAGGFRINNGEHVIV